MAYVSLADRYKLVRSIQDNVKSTISVGPQDDDVITNVFSHLALSWALR
jgi:hypothetical protein